MLVLCAVQCRAIREIIGLRGYATGIERVECIERMECIERVY